jgi:hypothetical protein
LLELLIEMASGIFSPVRRAFDVYFSFAHCQLSLKKTYKTPIKKVNGG